MPHKQRGAALAVALVMLVILTLLAVSGMDATTLGLKMASNTKLRNDAFQAAATATDYILSQPNIAGSGAVELTGDAGVSNTHSVNLLDSTGTEHVTMADVAVEFLGQSTCIGQGFNSGIVCHTTRIISNAEGARNERSEQVQGLTLFGVNPQTGGITISGG